MDTLLQQVINGLVLGSMYALVALGYTMVYGIINLINFAHGEVLMVGALTSWTVLRVLADSGLPGWVLLLISLAAAVVVCAALAALAGVMYAANYGTVQHTMGFLPGLKAFTAAVFGGIGNLGGAVVGGVLLGLIEALGSGYIGALTGGVLGSQYSDIFAFLVLILVLTVRPQGLLGERVADRA